MGWRELARARAKEVARLRGRSITVCGWRMPARACGKSRGFSVRVLRGRRARERGLAAGPVGGGV